MSRKKTPWFPTNTTPARPGVYETSNGFQHWNGEFWGLYSSTPGGAHEYIGYRSHYQNPHWRGFTTEQKR